MAKANRLAQFTAFKSEDEAIALLESIRWPNGATCPHCGGAEPYRLTPKATTTTRTQKGADRARGRRQAPDVQAAIRR